MKHLLPLLAIFGSFLFSFPAAASEAIDAELFPAEFLSAQRETLGLNETQLNTIDKIMQAAKIVFEDGKTRLEAAAKDLQTLLKEDEPDPDKADEKMRAVLDHEGDIKILHLQTLLAVRRVLTPAQLVKARGLRDELMAKKAAAASTKQRLDGKLLELRNAITARFSSGGVPPEIIENAQQIQVLMNDRKETEAEKKIEETLKMVSEAKPAQPNP